MKIIAGPCQHESLEHSLKIANHCNDICKKYGIDYFFKASYDKANRTSLGGFRGQGIESVIKDFTELKKQVAGLKILTDVHESYQINWIESYFPEVIDVYQIPAFLCRQTDLILRACNTDKIVNIKKGQFLAPWDVKGILSKTNDAREVWITERGTSFGYNTLVVDFTGIQFMLENYSVPVVLDATHSVQKPGGAGDRSGGNRDYVPGLCRAASALGVSSFFLEVHDDPDNAPSDGPNMVNLDNFEYVIEQIIEINEVARKFI